MRLLAIFSALSLLDLTFAIENLRFFGVWYDAAVSNASITKFESTIIVPPPTPDRNISHDVQAFWPGLEDLGQHGVLQPVVTNQGGAVGDWYLLPFYYCNPAGGLAPQMRIYPEDTVKNVLALDASTGNWYMNWVVTPGPGGNNASAPPFGGGLIFDPTIDANVTGPYGRALLTIELQELGTWDFGDVEWRNIMIEANTTDIEWCLKGPSLVDEASPFNFTFSPPTASVLGTSTVCYIAQLIFHQPDLGSGASTAAHGGQRNGTVGRSVWRESSTGRRYSRRN